MSAFLMLVFLLGCGTKAEPANNPYFEDETQDDFEIFLTQFETSMDDLYLYYRSTYYDDSFIYPFDYQTKEGYQPLPQKELYSKDDLAINDQIIDERYLFKSSNLYYALDNGRYVYSRVLDDIKTCDENTYCEDDKGNFIHFSMNDHQIYFHYRVQYRSGDIDEYMYYFSKNRDKLHLTFFHKIYNEYNLEIEHIQYVEYDEEDKEINMLYDGRVYLSLYDIQTGYIMEKELISEDNFGVRYYDVSKEIEFWTHFYNDDNESYVYATFYKNHRWAISVNEKSTSVNYWRIRLNAFEGWNELHVTWLDAPPYREFYIAQDGQKLAEDFNIKWNMILGDVYIQEISFSIQTLLSEGIYFEYDDQEIIQICENFEKDLDSLEYIYNLYQSNQELLERFNEKTGSELSFPLY
jgi:hypothetical protein